MILKKVFVCAVCICTYAGAMDELYRTDGCELVAPSQEGGMNILRTADNRRLFELTPVLDRPELINIAFYVDEETGQRTPLGFVGPEGTGIKKIDQTNFFAIVVSGESGDAQTYILDIITARLSAPMHGKFVAYSSIGQRFVTFSPSLGSSRAFLTFCDFDGRCKTQILPESLRNIYLGTAFKRNDPATNWQPLDPQNLPIFHDHNWRYLHIEHRSWFITETLIRDAAVKVLPRE